MSAILAVFLLLQDPPAEESPLDVTYTDTLRFRARDGSFEGYLGGLARIHARTIFDRPDDDVAPLRTLPDQVFIRQFRLDTGGTFHKDWGYRFLMDFSTGTPNQSTGAPASSVTASLRDGWLEWKRFRELTVRVGQFFVPCSQEELDSGRLHELAERSPMNRLQPGRQLGLQLYGSLLEDRVRYYLMLHHGHDLVVDKGRNVPDTDDEKGLAVALQAWPLSQLRLGVSGTVTDVDDVPASDFDLISSELSVLWLDGSGGTFDGRRIRLDGHLLAFAGPASLRAELLFRRDDLAEGSPEDAVLARGGYLFASWHLTGEPKVPNTRVVPASEWGALELAARVSYVRLTDAFSSGVASPIGNTDHMTAVSVGATWWHGRHLRLTLSAIREHYSDPLGFDHRSEDTLWGLVARFQVDF